MPKVLSRQDMVREAIRGNVDRDALKRPEPEPPKADPVQTALHAMTAVHEQSMGKVGEAVNSMTAAVTDLSRESDAKLQSIIKQLTAKQDDGTTWVFNVTKRDSDGNVETFTARKERG